MVGDETFEDFPRALAARFAPIALLGRGSMGLVYHVRADGQDLALKLIQQLQANRLNRERFAREARVMAALTHPRIVRYAGAGLSEPVPWVTMELLSGGTLAERLRAGRIEEAEAHALVASVLDGLAHLHGKGLLHRDLKPSNVFLDRVRGPVLIDLGLARRLDATTVLTEPGIVMGSLAYMAPELMLDAPHSARTDLFAMGAVAFETLAGAGLHDDGAGPLSVADVTASLAGGTYYSSVRRRLPSRASSLGKAILRALAPEPKDRFASAAAMAAALA